MKFTANKNEVLIWLGTTDEPNLIQPTWPDGTAWANDDEASKWAKAWVAAAENPNSEFLPGDNPSQPLKPRPLPEPEVLEADGTPVDEAAE